MISRTNRSIGLGLLALNMLGAIGSECIFDLLKVPPRDAVAERRSSWAKVAKEALDTCGNKVNQLAREVVNVSEGNLALKSALQEVHKSEPDRISTINMLTMLSIDRDTESHFFACRRENWLAKAHTHYISYDLQAKNLAKTVLNSVTGDSSIQSAALELLSLPEAASVQNMLYMIGREETRSELERRKVSLIGSAAY